ncbi:50S ribosomal protein L29 [Candidatus Brocadiaceae bacterium B188]|nr:50S ribosomal protein L29 [Candidatus Brocadia sapporoensis]QQR67129.1 MAG: 50S ribosomal protein L29 [Candidatus Brocadia sp.]RZV58424.1 MAG: 50S ribosomal protein L29 [Candidatus Brocadia sp. BROELEC01]TWU54151.1 50S ribosomal protein L29 [Candidatus Brocadiaceae bacterium B188]
MIIDEMRSKSRQELLNEIDASRRELLNIQFQWLSGETRDSAQRKKIKKNIARLNTVLREMALGINSISQVQGADKR